MDLINRALAYIEDNVRNPIELSVLASQLNVSTVYLSKVFKLNLGESPIQYARVRRLSEAARFLIARPKTSILDVALEFGLESHEAFTRSFKKQFAMTPEKFRTMSLGDVQHLLRGPLDKFERSHFNKGVFMTMKMKITEIPAFLVVGLKANYNQESKINIPQLWPQFVRRIEEIPNVIPWVTYGVCVPSKTEEGEFDYMAAIGVKTLTLENLPAGLEAMVIPKGKYAVFTHKLTSQDIGANMRAANQYIWEEWMPKSGQHYNGGPDFELYDKRFDPEKDHGEIDIYVPLT